MICHNCGKDYEGDIRSKYCSPDCYVQAKIYYSQLRRRTGKIGLRGERL